MANTKVTGDLIASLTIATGNIANNAITSDKISGLTTAHITEGANLYYTDARARAAVSVSGNALSYNSSTGVITSNFEESPTFTGNVTLSSTSPILYLANTTATTGKTWRLSSAANGNAYITQDGVIDAITLSHTTGNTTFAGAVTATGTILSNTQLRAVTSSGGVSGYFTDAVNSTLQIKHASGQLQFLNGSNNIWLTEYGSTNVTFAGNVGIGITPSASFSGIEVLQLGGGMTLYGGGGDRATMASNLIVNTGTAFEYVINGLAGRFSIEDGNMIWSTAPTGTAGQVATVTTRMTLLNNGNVGIGETNPQRPLHINGTEGAARFTSTASGNNGFEVGIGTSSQAFLWQTENSHMQFATNNAERMRIDSSGRVGIGTTAPSETLQVNGNIRVEGVGNVIGFDTTGALLSNGIKTINDYETLIYNGRGASGFAVIGNSNIRLGFGTNYTNAETDLFIDSSGNVGIGTDTPASKLHVQGGAIGVTTGQKIGWLYNPTAATPDNNMYNYILTADNGGVPASPLEISGSRWTSGNTRGVIFTHQTGGEIMTIMTGGNVGIGTTSPGSKSVVAGGTDTSYNDGTLKVVGSIALNSANNLNPSLNRWALRPRAAGVEGSFDIYDARHSLSRLTIDDSGNVGIGTTLPGEKLDVAGNIKANDVSGKFYTNAYTLAASDTFVNTVTVTGTCLYEYTIAVNPNTAGSSAYTDYYYGKVGIGIGWNGGAVTQYIFQDADETAPRSLYNSGGGNISISIRMIYSGGVYTELAANTTAVIRFQGFSTSNTGVIFLRRLA
jgi:hypothetical protein